MGSRRDIIRCRTEAEYEARREAARREAEALWEYEYGWMYGPRLDYIVGIYSVDDRFWERHAAE